MPTFIETLPASTSAFFEDLEHVEFADQSQLSLTNAWICAEASALTFKPAPFITEFAARLKPVGWDLRVFTEGSTSAIVMLRGGIAILAFRGSRVPAFPDLLRQEPINFQDLTTNLGLALIAHPKRGRIHTGFFRAYTQFWTIHGKEILNLVGQRSLFIAGHSLGAAIATVAARDLESVRALYTFGSPRVGDAEFQAGFIEIGLPVYRFVHEYDLVTTVPPEEMNYRHISDLLHIKGTGEAIELLTSSRQPTLADGLTRGVTAAPAFIKDIARYLANNIGELDLKNAPVPDDALAQHAPWNYTTKLWTLATRIRKAGS